MMASISIILISILSTVLAASDTDTNIICHGLKGNLLVLRIGGTVRINCTVSANFTEEIRANLTKISSNCPDEKSSSEIHVTVNEAMNDSTVIELSFMSVSWGVGGDFILIVQVGNATVQKKILARVSDVPVLPIINNITFTNYMHHGDHVLALVATLTKVHKCSYRLKRTYKFSYKSFDCSVEKKRMDILCEVDDDMDGFSKDLVCQADQTIVCENSQLKDCRYSINVTGSNALGSTSLFNVKTPRLRYTVPALPARFLKLRATGPKALAVSWLKPFCSKLTFSYSLHFIDVKTNVSSKAFFIRNEDVTIRKSINNLKPYTKYRVCVKVLNLEAGSWSKESCTENQTLEDVPSKAPEITNVVVRRMGQGNAKWESEITWKVPPSEFWNGKPYIQIEYFEVKTPQQSRKSRKMSFAVKKYILKDLEKGREYSVRVNLCTNQCKSSEWKNISLPEKKSTLVWSLTFGILSVVVVIVLAIVLYLCRKGRYERMRNDAVTMENPSISNMTVYPRNAEGYYEEIDEHARGYDIPPRVDNDDNNDLVDEEEPIEDVRLEISASNDYGAQHLDETELVTIRT